MFPLRSFSALAVLLVVGATSNALAGAPSNHKIDRAVQDALRRGAATQAVIITVKPGYRDTLRRALRQHGDVIKSEHPLIDGLAVQLHSGDIVELANQPWVEAIAADAIVSTTGTRSSLPSALNNQSAMTVNLLRQTLGLPSVSTSATPTPTGATGITVAVIDSGIAPLLDFEGRLTAFYDFTRGGIPMPAYDDYGHGTHVAGLIGSNGVLSNYQFQGIAPDVHLVGLKVLDSKGQGLTSNVITAIEFVVANKAHLNVQIINLSLGHPIYAPAKDDPLVQAVEKATAAGFIVVAAAGNHGEKERTGEPGYTGITSPGNAPSAITVGAVMTRGTVTRSDDVVASYSSRGPSWFDAFEKPDVVAPGHHLISDTSLFSSLYKELTTNRTNAANGQPLLMLSGSSMATAVTSGVVALVLQAHNQNGFHRQPPLTANLVKAILQFTAIRIPGADYLTQGGGEINAAGAIALAKAIDTSQKAGSWWVGTGVTTSTVIGDESYAWAKQIVWGNTVVGGNVVYANNICWGTNITWGTNIVWGTSAPVDATNITWGSSAVWGRNIVWSDRLIGQAAGDNIVWGTRDGDNIVWGAIDGDNIVWGTWDGDNIIWGTWDGDNIIWGTTTAAGDNIIWGTSAGDNVIWGTAGVTVWGAIGVSW